ncbi:MAG: DUF58 domain-containing protein [Halieaceae bacterium]|nr:DUF58 domain-containing protein [Halieaceae bacterium]
MFSSLQTRWQARWQRFFASRSPRQARVTLTQKRIYILPTRGGFACSLLLLVLLVAGINCQNNLIYGLTFWLATLFLLATWHTYQNMAGLQLSARATASVFAGGAAQFELTLKASTKKSLLQLVVETAHGDRQNLARVDETPVRLIWAEPTAHRGWHHPERLTLSSSAPFGLFRCWAYAWLDARALVYPKPIEAVIMSDGCGQGDTRPLGSATTQELDGFRPYREGDHRKHIHWVTLAKGQPLQTREQALQQENESWVLWEYYVGAIEQRLSAMCQRVLTLSEHDKLFGLGLPGLQIAPSRGYEHRAQCLQALALYHLEETS